MHISSSVWRGGLAVLVAALALTTALAWAAPATDLIRPLLGLEETRTGTDPLSTTEQARALELAQAHDPVAALYKAHGRIETLLVERWQEEKNALVDGDWPRRAEVALYVYETNTFVQVVVNLKTGAVDALTTAQNVQYPLTPAEQARALELALADAETRTRIEADYQTQTRTALTNPARQLVAQALIFSADTLPTRATEATQGCGLERCAQILLMTPDTLVVNVLPIVNLSTGQVASADFFAQEK